MKKLTYAASAFTYLEILVVVAVLAVLGCLIIPRMTLGDGELRPKDAARQMREIIKALELYRQENGFYPSTEQGLQALVQKPAGAPVPKHWRQYLDRIPLDPWHHEFSYRCPGSDHGMNVNGDRDRPREAGACYDLKSFGTDGVESDDDLNSWNLPEER